jgi:starvation-inducible DNA-binding protein
MSSRALKVAVLNTTHHHWTKNDLPAKVRQASGEVLNSLVIEGIDVALAARYARWNVRGPHFAALHELFGSVYDEVNQQVDVLAERAVALGMVARGTVQDVASETALKPYPMLSISEQEHIEAMARRLGIWGGDVRRAIEECEKLGDRVSADVLSEACAAIEKLLWRVESHQFTLHS